MPPDRNTHAARGGSSMNGYVFRSFADRLQPYPSRSSASAADRVSQRRESVSSVASGSSSSSSVGVYDWTDDARSVETTPSELLDELELGEGDGEDEVHSEARYNGDDDDVFMINAKTPSCISRPRQRAHSPAPSKVDVEPAWKPDRRHRHRSGSIASSSNSTSASSSSSGSSSKQRKGKAHAAALRSLHAYQAAALQNLLQTGQIDARSVTDSTVQAVNESAAAHWRRQEKQLAAILKKADAEERRVQEEKVKRRQEQTKKNAVLKTFDEDASLEEMERAARKLRRKLAKAQK